MQSNRTSWRWAAVAFVFVLLIVAGFSLMPGIRACPTSAEPILAFELVKSPAELAQLFPENCRTAALIAQEKALWLDILAFVPAYGSALVLTLLALGAGQASRAGLVQAAIAAVLMAMVFDQWENSRLMLLAGNMPGDQVTFDQLVAAPRIKFALLAMAEAAAGWLLWQGQGIQRLPGAAVLLGAGMTMIGLMQGSPLIALGGSIAFLALAITAWTVALRGARN